MDPSEWIEFTGLTLFNFRLEVFNLPGRQITDDMLYHMFASGLFDVVKVKRAYESRPEEYGRVGMQRWVQEKDRHEIRKLQAELANVKAKAQ